MRRRSLLRLGATLGGSSLLGAGVSATRSQDDAASPETLSDPTADEERPLEAEGQMTIEYTKLDENSYRRDRWFESEALEKRYGRATIEYDSIEVPEDYVPKDVRAGPNNRRQYTDARVIGTLEEHQQAEDALRRASDQQLSLLSTDLDVDDVPLYQYEGRSEASSERMADRAAPINVAWESITQWVSGSAEYIKNTMQNAPRGGNQWLRSKRAGLIPNSVYEVDMYVNDDGNVRSTDEHVFDHISDWWCAPGTKQWHIRLTDIPNTDSDIEVIGQAHRDPCLHGHEMPGDFNSDNFHLDRAQEQASDWWTDYISDMNVEYVDVGNEHNDHSTHDGTIAVLGYEL